MRKFKNITPYTTKVFAKDLNKEIFKDYQELLNELQQKRSKVKKIKAKSKAWKSRVKNQLRAIDTEAQQIKTAIEKVNELFGDNYNNESVEFLYVIDMYSEFSGVIPTIYDGTSYQKWKSYVNYYFNGNEYLAIENFNFWKSYHEGI